MKNIYRFLLGVLMVLALAVGLLLFISVMPFGSKFKLYSVMSGSMEPDIGVGSLIVVRQEDKYAVGDAITFLPSDASRQQDTKTHRIITVEKKNGKIFFKTKGDANSIADTELVPLDKVIGKVSAKISYVGYIFGYAKTLPGIILVVVIPSTIIVYDEIGKIKKELIKIRAKKLSKTSPR